jgi:hypothetical protein
MPPLDCDQDQGPAPDHDPRQRAEAVADEQRRARRLRMVVDLVTGVLMQGHLDRAEAEALVAAARTQALVLFPDKEGTYDLVLAPRFARLLDEFVGPPAPRKLLPFPPR